jgi:hypothetical protein
MDRVEASARRLLAGVEQGEALRAHLDALARHTRRDVTDTISLRRRLAAAAIEAGGYPL